MALMQQKRDVTDPTLHSNQINIIIRPMQLRRPHLVSTMLCHNLISDHRTSQHIHRSEMSTVGSLRVI